MPTRGKRATRVKDTSSASTILVVEDNPASLDYLATLLRYQQYIVVEAMNAFDGLASARALRPDLVIADVVMPDCDGYEFTRLLRADENTARIPIIFWTATYGDRGSAILLAENLGVDCVLGKPSEPHEILRAVEKALEHPRHTTGALTSARLQEEHTRLLTNTVFEQVSRLQSANQQLRVSENQYRMLFEANPLPMWISDNRRQRFLAINRAAEARYGASIEQFPEASATTVTRQSIIFEGQPAWLEVSAEHVPTTDTEEQLQRLAVRLRSAQEEERTKLSRQLHDQFGQQLTALRMNTDWMLMREAVQEEIQLQERLRASLKIVDELITMVQKLSMELRPGILDFGIAAAVETLVQDFGDTSGIDCSVNVPDDDANLEPSRAAEIYRILQEALANVARHSGASRLEVQLTRSGSSLVLTVIDDGRGITPEQLRSPAALGLLGMRERAAQIGAAISITGGKGGTRLQLDVPLPPESPQPHTHSLGIQ